jgi:hypothetical protein
MERENAADGKIQWQKVGGGSFQMGRRLIKPGEKFFAFKEEIPKAFRDVVVPLDGSVTWDKETKKEEKPVYPVTNVTYTITPIEIINPKGKSPLWWNVIGKDGKVLNEKALRKADAEKLITYNLVSSEGKVLNEKALNKQDAEDLLLALGK